MFNECLSWDVENIRNNSLSMCLLIPTFIFHILFWIQVGLYKPLRHSSILWIYNYLILDLVSLFQLFLEYITRRLINCDVSFIGYNLLCILEAYTNSYTTMVQAFALVLTNIYRYKRIVKNKVITMNSIVSIIFIHLLLYLLPLSILIVQYFLSQTQIIDIPGLSCSVEYAPFYNQLIGLLIFAVLPTCINIPFVLMMIRHVRSSQLAVQSVRCIHRHLTIEFIILYSIWLSFFLPQPIFMFVVTLSPSMQLMTSKLLNISATLSDVVVITIFDHRFIDAWKKSLHYILIFMKRDGKRINQAVMEIIPLPQIK